MPGEGLRSAPDRAETLPFAPQPEGELVVRDGVSPAR